MSFENVYSSGTIGQTYTVSDGTMQPPGGHNSREYQEWRGRNFSGTLVSKVAGPPRRLNLTMPDFGGALVTVTEPSWQGADRAVEALSEFSPNSSMTLAPNGALDLAPNGELTLDPNGGLNVTPNGSINFVPNGYLNAWGAPLCARRLSANITGAASVADARNYDHFRMTLTGNVTALTMSQLEIKSYVFEFVQDATGSRTISLGSQFKFGTDVTGYTPTATAGKRDFIYAQCDGTNLYVTRVVRGY